MQLKIECTAGAVLAGSDGRILRQHQRVDAHRTRTGGVAVEKKRRFVVSYVLSFIAGRGHAVRTQAALVTVAELITGLRRHEHFPLGEYEGPYPQQKEKSQASLAGPDQPLEHFFLTSHLLPAREAPIRGTVFLLCVVSVNARRFTSKSSRDHQLRR